MTLGESVGAVFGVALLGGMLVSLTKLILIRLFKKIGIDYFAEIAESYRWIGQLMIESRAVMNADRAVFYRTSNGRVFVEDSGIDINSDVRVYAISNCVKNKSLTPLPALLTRKYFDWFLAIQKIDNYLEMFPSDLPINSQLRNNLDKYGVKAYMSVKVKFGNDLYGVIIFTWSDIAAVPRNLITKHREYLDDLKNSILIETIFIISRSLKFRIYDLFGKNPFHKGEL